MRSTLTLEVEGGTLARTTADLAVTGFFRDQRPLPGGAGLADWRLCGWLSALLESTRMRGDVGEGVLVLTHGRLRASRLLLIGLGARSRYGSDAYRIAVRDALLRMVGLGAASAALDLPPPQADPSPERIARSLLEGAFEALEQRPGRVVLRLVATGWAARLRGALEQAATALPKGSTSLKLVRPPAPPATRAPDQPGARPGAPRPRPARSGS